MNELPAFLQNRQSKAVAQTLVQNLGTGSPPYLSIKGNRFTLVDAAGAEETIATYDPKIGIYVDVVIIDVNDVISKIFYDKPFDPNASNYEPPACWSDNGVGPSRNASVPQAPTCAACPNSAWGSAVSKISGKGIKACSDTQKIAFIRPGDPVTFLLRVPPNSLGKLREYTLKFAGQTIDISDVITRISFEPNGVGTLLFSAVNYIDEPTFNQREAVSAEKKTDALVGRLDTVHPGGAALAAQPQQQALAAPIEQRQAAPESFQMGAGPLAGGAPPAGNVQTPSTALPSSGVATSATPSPSEPAPRQRRQRKTAEAAPPAATGTPTAPFPTGTPVTAAGAAAVPATAAAPFGMGTGTAPDPGLQAALNSVFGR